MKRTLYGALAAGWTALATTAAPLAAHEGHTHVGPTGGLLHLFAGMDVLLVVAAVGLVVVHLRGRARGPGGPSGP